MESLINKFTNEYTCFYSLLKVRGGLKQRTIAYGRRGRKKVENHWPKMGRGNPDLLLFLRGLSRKYLECFLHIAPLPLSRPHILAVVSVTPKRVWVYVLPVTAHTFQFKRGFVRNSGDASPKVLKPSVLFCEVCLFF